MNLWSSYQVQVTELTLRRVGSGFIYFRTGLEFLTVFVVNKGEKKFYDGYLEPREISKQNVGIIG